MIEHYFSDLTPIKWLQCRVVLLLPLISLGPFYSNPQYYFSNMLIPCIDLNTAGRNYDVARQHTDNRSYSRYAASKDLMSAMDVRAEKMLDFVVIRTMLDIQEETLNSLNEQKKSNDFLPKPDDGSNRAYEKIQAGQTEEWKLAMEQSVRTVITAAHKTGIEDPVDLLAIARKAASASKNQHETDNANLRTVAAEIHDDDPSAANPDLSRFAEKIEVALQATQSQINRMAKDAQTIYWEIYAIDRQIESLSQRCGRKDEAVREAEAAEISAKEELDNILDAYNKYILQNPEATEVPLGFYNCSDQYAAQEYEYTSPQDIIDTRQHSSQAQESVDSYDTPASQVVYTFPNVMTDNL